MLNMQKKQALTLLLSILLLHAGFIRAQNEANAWKISTHFLYQKNKKSYSPTPTFYGFMPGIGYERFLLRNLSASIHLSAIAGFYTSGITILPYINPELRYYIGERTIKSIYLGASFGYGFSDANTYYTFSPTFGYMRYLGNRWYLDINAVVGSGRIATEIENSDGLFFTTGLKLVRLF
jgi:hypothetical protein